MFERFSDRARKVMALANMEAQRFNHECIGTEHLLLGLLEEGGGVGVTVLKKQGVDIETLRAEIEKLVRSGYAVPGGKLPQTPRAKRVIEYAVAEARSLNHKDIGTEHILLGLLRETEGIASHVLVNLGLTIENTRQTIAGLQQTGASCESSEPPIRQSDELDHLCSLTAYQPADELTHAVYKVAGGFPKEEIYGIGSHLRRTALLIPPNIAAAYRRSGQTGAKWFVDIALGLLRELRYGLDFAVELGYLKAEEQDELGNLIDEIDEELTDFGTSLAKLRDS